MADTIRSFSNAFIQRARRAAVGSASGGDALVVGVQPVTYALRSGAQIEYVLVTPELRGGGTILLEELILSRVQVREVAADILQRLVETDRTSVVVAVVRCSFVELGDLLNRNARSWVALHRVSNPGNLGSVLRSADAFGIGGVILLDDCCSPWSARAIKASMGSVFHVGVSRASFGDFCGALSGHGIRTLGAVGGSGGKVQASSATDRVCIVLGNEGAGLPSDVIAACDELVGIPMVGAVDSLNLAVAGAILMYELMLRDSRS